MLHTLVSCPVKMTAPTIHSVLRRLHPWDSENSKERKVANSTLRHPQTDAQPQRKAVDLPWATRSRIREARKGRAQKLKKTKAAEGRQGLGRLTRRSIWLGEMGMVCLPITKLPVNVYRELLGCSHSTIAAAPKRAAQVLIS